MRHSLTVIAGAVLASAILAGPLASSAFAAKAGGQRISQGHYGKVSVAPYRFFRCKGGRYYTYGGGSGCDYYRYSRDFPYGRR